jgi:Flp pilus assembly pilin Flp
MHAGNDLLLQVGVLDRRGREGRRRKLGRFGVPALVVPYAHTVDEGISTKFKALCSTEEICDFLDSKLARAISRENGALSWGTRGYRLSFPGNGDRVTFNPKGTVPALVVPYAHTVDEGISTKFKALCSTEETCARDQSRKRGPQLGNARIQVVVPR